jgi:hypothetical protein
VADPYARNPAYDDMVAKAPDVYRALARKQAPPTLFPNGDLPQYTASGNPPSALMDLPWQLRHAAARADQAEWARIHAEYGKGVPDADIAMMYEPAANDHGNADYQGRMHAWAMGQRV